jgi:hypothetical protein
MTIVQSGAAYAVKKESVALAALAVRKPTNLTRLMGQAPAQSGAESVLKQQSNPGLPGIMVRDLASGPGEKITIEAVDIVGGYPIMGDQIREGKGVAMNIATMDAKIDLASKVVNSGATMTQKRTKIQLRPLAMAQLMGYFPRLLWQRSLVQMAGARGAQADRSWHLPLQSDANFASYLINPVLAPTYNRHLVIDGSSFVQGGAQLGSIDSTDAWTLSHIDRLSEYLDSVSFKLQPVRIPGDPAAEDDPIKGLLMLDPQAWTQLLTDTTATNNIRTWQATAMERAKLSGANMHPLFRGEIYMWNGILIRKMEHSIYFNPSDTTKIVTSANKLTATETDQTVNASLTSGYRVTRSVLLGAQAFGVCLGSNASTGIEAAFKERSYDYDSKYEAMGEWMGGECKLRFKFENDNGDLEPTDHGIVVIDAAARAVG